MFLGRMTNLNSVANTNLPITTEFNTNNKIRYNSTNNTIELLKDGIYNLDGYLVVSGSTSPIVATIYADGNPVATSEGVTLATATDIDTIPLIDAFRVVRTLNPNVANISIRLNLADISVSGVVRVEYLQ